jgi:isoamylase
MDLSVQPGNSYPLGATVYDHGVNFCLYSKNATGIDLLLFDSPEAPYPSHTIHLNPQHHRSFHYWHVFVGGSRQGKFMPTGRQALTCPAKGSGLTRQRS